MTLISKSSKVYVYADTKITLLDGGEPTNERTIPNAEGNVKDYYGDLEQKQQDLYFQPSSIIGTTTGKTSVFNKILYYQILIENTVDKRTGHGWGAGTYEKIPWYGWASSADITDNEQVALEKYNKRTDGASLVEIQKANADSNPNVNTSTKIDAPKTTKNNTVQNDTPKKSNIILYVGIGIIVVAGIVVTIVYFKKKKLKEIQALPLPQTIY